MANVVVRVNISISAAGQHADVLGDDGGGRTLGDGEERGIGA